MASNIKNFFKKTHDQYKAFKGKVDELKRTHDAPAHATRAPHHEDKTQKIEITASSATFAKFISLAILLLLVTGFLYEIRTILVIFFVSLLFAAALDPMVDALERRRIPRALGVVFIYLIVLTVIGLFISNLVPIVAREVSELAIRAQDFLLNLARGEIELPQWLNWLKPILQRIFEGIDVTLISSYRDVLLEFAKQLSSVAGNLFNAVIGVFNGFFNTILIFVLTFLMIVDENGIDRFILSMFPSRYEKYIEEKSLLIKSKMGHWLRGQITLCLVVGVLVYIGFLVVGLFTGGVKYAATISMLAGFLELIPYAGPFLAWMIALPIMANQSLGLVVWMTVMMYAVQLLENNVIVPVVMNRAVGLSPIFVMFAVLVGFEFLGVLGIVLAVPVATAFAIFLKDYAEKEK